MLPKKLNKSFFFIYIKFLYKKSHLKQVQISRLNIQILKH